MKHTTLIVLLALLLAACIPTPTPTPTPTAVPTGTTTWVPTTATNTPTPTATATATATATMFAPTATLKLYRFRVTVDALIVRDAVRGNDTGARLVYGSVVYSIGPAPYNSNEVWVELANGTFVAYIHDDCPNKQCGEFLDDTTP